MDDNNIINELNNMLYEKTVNDILLQTKCQLDKNTDDYKFFHMAISGLKTAVNNLDKICSEKLTDDQCIEINDEFNNLCNIMNLMIAHIEKKDKSKFYISNSNIIKRKI